MRCCQFLPGAIVELRRPVSYPAIAIASTASGVHSSIGGAGDSRPRLITTNRSHSPNGSGRSEVMRSTAFPSAAQRAIVSWICGLLPMSIHRVGSS